MLSGFHVPRPVFVKPRSVFKNFFFLRKKTHARGSRGSPRPLGTGHRAAGNGTAAALSLRKNKGRAGPGRGVPRGHTSSPKVPSRRGETCGAPDRSAGLPPGARKCQASPCFGPRPAAAAPREPRPWRRGSRARAAGLCEERRGWAAAAAGAPRGAAAAPPPLASLPHGGGRPRDSATIPEAPGKASSTPRAPPELPPPSILEPGKEATRGLPSLRATREPQTAGQ